MKRYKNSYLSYLLMYFFFYFGVALFSCLISVYLMDLGYSASKISFVISCSYLSSMLFQPLLGKQNDQRNVRRWNIFLLVICALIGLLFSQKKSLLIIALLYSLVITLMNSTKVVVENMATKSPYTYGSIRIWATVGYAVGSRFCGYLYYTYSSKILYYFFSIGLILCIIGLAGTSVNWQKHEQTNISIFSILNKSFIWYLVIVCLFYGITNVHTLYLPTLLKTKSLSVDVISIVIFLSTLVELPVIWFAKYYMNRFSNKLLLTICLGLLCLEIGSICFISSIFINIFVIIATKAVVTMSFIMINLKVVTTLVKTEALNTGLSLVSSCNCFASMLFQFLAGFLIDCWGYQVFYFNLFIFCIITFIIVRLSPIYTDPKLKLFN